MIFEGIVLGLILAAMLGPIFVALTQTAIEKGSKAGLTVAAGIWVSDILFILCTYFFINKISGIVEDQSFKYWMGLSGGFILITFGLGAFFKKQSEKLEIERFSAKNYFSFFSKGFLVNTINPFTFIFWITIISTKVFARKLSQQEVLTFLTTIFFMIMFTDSLKVLLAKVIRNKLQPKHISWFTKISGASLVVFGFVVLWKSKVF